MGACARCLLIAVAGFALSSPAAWSQPKQAKKPGVVSSIDRFSGPLTAAGKTGAKTAAAVAAAPTVHYQTLSLAPHVRANPRPPDTRSLALPLRARGGGEFT